MSPATNTNAASSLMDDIRAVLARRGVFWGVQIIALAGAAVCWASIGGLSGGWRALVVLVGVLCTIAPAILTWSREKHDATERDDQQADQVDAFALLQGYLAPALAYLSDMASAESQETFESAWAQLRTNVGNAAQHMCGPQDSSVRAVLFEAQDRTMRQFDWSGGPRGSNREFLNRKSDQAGKTAWTTAESGQATVWDDLDQQVPEGFSHGERNYKTFITCGVVHPARHVCGMLNVDAMRPGSLTELDRRIVELLASVLGLGYALRDAVSMTPRRGGN